MAGDQICCILSWNGSSLGRAKSGGFEDKLPLLILTNGNGATHGNDDKVECRD